MELTSIASKENKKIEKERLLDHKNLVPGGTIQDLLVHVFHFIDKGREFQRGYIIACSGIARTKNWIL